MKAIGTKAVGSTSKLELVETPLPEVAAHQVRVRVHAASVNPADLKTVAWEGSARLLHKRVTPLVPGYDFSGVVDGVGADVRGVEIGASVFGHLPYSSANAQGTFAEYVVVSADQIAPKPDEVEHTAAACCATVGLTAMQALRKAANDVADARVLILGASGGVGSLAVGIAKMQGAHVTGVCSKYALGFVEGLGADEVIDRGTTNALEQEKRFDVIFDTSGRYTFGDCANALAPQGTFVTTMPGPDLLAGKLRTLLSTRNHTFVMVKSRSADLQQLAQWMVQGLSVPIAERFGVGEAGSALKALAVGGVLGKIAIRVENGF